MTEKVSSSLRESPTARWTALAIVSFTMFCGYFIADAMSPLKPMLESQLKWDNMDYGIFTSAYGWFNVHHDHWCRHEVFCHLPVLSGRNGTYSWN